MNNNVKRLYLYLQETSQLTKIPTKWKSTVEGYVIQVLGAPDLYGPPSELAARLSSIAPILATIPEAQSWYAVSQATNRVSQDSNILHPFLPPTNSENNARWGELLQNAYTFAAFCKAHGAKGFLHDLDDYAHRHRGTYPGWIVDKSFFPEIKRRGEQFASAIRTSLDYGIMDHVTASSNWPGYRMWLRGSAPSSAWIEDSFNRKSSREAYIAAKRYLNTVFKVKQIHFGSFDNPEEAASSTNYKFTSKLEVNFWCFPWARVGKR